MGINLNTELFLLPEQNAYLVYAPLRGYVMRLNAENVNVLDRIKRGCPREEDVRSDLLAALIKAGIVNGHAEKKPPTAVGSPYAPMRVTLLLTNRCNLACSYCYAGKQSGQLVMSPEIGMAAIEYAAANCVARNHKTLDVGFHSGGEPTCAWEELTVFHDHAKRVAAQNDLELRMGIATNGYLSKEKAEWIARGFTNVNISLDGPPRIQNEMRPTKGGQPTAKVVRRTLQILQSHGTPYGIQATITKKTVREMPSMVDYFSRYTKPTLVKFEPVSDCGRFSGYADQIPSGKEFAASFDEAFQLGARRGLHIAFSGVRLSGPGLSYFCGAFGEPFAVTPDGFVSACYEVYSSSAPMAETFILGQFDPATREFRIDHDKLDALRNRNIYTLPACQKCFCRYSCAGDCATRNFRFTGRSDLGAVGARCEAIREITRRRLTEIADHTEKQFVNQEESHVRTKQY